MALADARSSGYACESQARLDTGPADPTPCAPPCHCASAIRALEQALSAIARDDIPARCEAVAAATEAATCLFLEPDGIVQEIPGQDIGRLFDSILGRLLRVNLLSDAAAVRETTAVFTRLRSICRRWDGAGRPPAAAYPRDT